MKSKKALILGSTGLIGKNLLQLLLQNNNYNAVYAPVRKLSGQTNPKLKEIQTDFENISAKNEMFQVDDVFCCIGTTIAKAGNKEIFRKVDLEIPVIFAKYARDNGAAKYLVVSSIGADQNSLAFYTQTKGKLEDELKKIGFSALYIFRPSLLLGERKEFRVGEEAAKFAITLLPFVFSGFLKKYKPIQGKAVARVMLKKAGEESNGIFILESQEIQEEFDSSN